MSWFKNLFGSGEEKHRPVLKLAPTRGFTYDIVGEAYCQKALTNIAGGKGEFSASIEKMAVLKCENDNAHDSNAVSVNIDGQLVGYLPGADAPKYRAELSKLDSSLPNCLVKAKIVGGWQNDEDEGHFGVKLNVKRPLALRKAN